MVICLTGGIGSGKSVVASIFESLGALIFNSDQVAKDLYFEEGIKSKIIALLGSDAYLSDGRINKTFISSSIFSNKMMLQELNAIIHPAVIKEFELFKKKHPQKILIKETALLFEAHLETNCDKILVVAANDELRIKRVMKRDQLSETEVRNKLLNQLSQNEKIERSDVVIYNDEKTLLIPQVIQLYEQFTKASKE